MLKVERTNTSLKLYLEEAPDGPRPQGESKFLIQRRVGNQVENRYEANCVKEQVWNRWQRVEWSNARVDEQALVNSRVRVRACTHLPHVLVTHGYVCTRAHTTCTGKLTGTCACTHTPPARTSNSWVCVCLLHALVTHRYVCMHAHTSGTHW